MSMSDVEDDYGQDVSYAYSSTLVWKTVARMKQLERYSGNRREQVQGLLKEYNES